MAVPTASTCAVVLNQQREQAIQHHEQCDRVTIVPCKAVSSHCTVVENGKVVVKLLPVQPTQPQADVLPES